MQNFNNASPSQWLAFIPGMNDLTFKLQNFVIPGVSVNPITLPNHSNKIAKVPGDRLQYEDLELRFIVDSTYCNHRAVLNWLKCTTDHYDVSEYPILRDINVQLLDNNGVTQNVVINFTDCFPTNVGRLEPVSYTHLRAHET